MALIWHLTQGGGSSDVALANIAVHLRELGLWSKVDKSRLRGSLRTRPEIIRGRGVDSFRIRSDLLEEIGATFTAAAVSHRRETDAVLSSELTLGRRRHLQRLRAEINGTYQSGCFDSCAVMSRRLAEVLLIEAFANSGQMTAITSATGQLKGLADLIAIAINGSALRLSRTAPRTLEQVKSLGDAAAHSRYHLTSRQEIDALNLPFRHLISELSSLAGLDSP